MGLAERERVSSVVLVVFVLDESVSVLGVSRGEWCDSPMGLSVGDHLGADLVCGEWLPLREGGHHRCVGVGTAFARS